jgi:uncharacterized protein
MKYFYSLFLAVFILTGIQADPLAEVMQKAKQGYALAQLALGILYYEGEGVPQNYAEAVK